MYIKELNNEVVTTIKVYYDDFFNFYQNKQKLGFVKLLKECTGMGLKESKENADKIFDGSIEDFKRNFNIQRQRKEKLEFLKKKLFAEEIINIFKEKSYDDILEKLSELDSYILEEILDRLL